MSKRNPQLPVGDPKKVRVASASLRFSVSLLGGLIIGVVIGKLISWMYAPLAGWDAAAIVFLGWVWASIYGRDAQATANLAIREDPGRAGADLLLLLASIASLAAVGVLLGQGGNTEHTPKILAAGLGIVSVVISWALVHTLYTLRYARMFYRNKGGIEFHGDEPPQYSDFAYLAFTIGMTFQVSDDDFTTNEFRRVGLRHALLSFLFGAVILASTINLIVGLGK
jgi:uncharacterized membrane protein